MSQPANVTKAGLHKNKEMYALVRDIGKLGFLNKPQGYGWLWEVALIDRNRATDVAAR